MSKHRKGPWETRREGRTIVIESAYGADDVCRIQQASEEIDTANAHLIAAAPEIYEALKAIVYLDLEEYGFMVADGMVTEKTVIKDCEAFEEARQKLRTAIAKAEASSSAAPAPAGEKP